jgi:transposase InsO family protein
MDIVTVIGGLGRRVARKLVAQLPKRHLERDLKKSVVAFVRWARGWHGMTWSQVAAALRVSAETLQRWRRRWRLDRLEVQARGRPIARAETEVRNLVFAVLGLFGPETPVTVLQELLPAVARRELDELVTRYRRVWRKRRCLLHELQWRNDGAVWAMDFTEPPAAIDDEYPYVFVVRDLGSGVTLMALPVPSQSGRVVRDALAALFRQHDAPLVLKCDNGAGFIAAETRALLKQHDVIPLLSPAYTPRFNGSCEAGIGGIKTRAHHEAARHGRPADWTCDDVENARLRGNANARPRGPNGPSPNQLWNERARVIDRTRLRRAVETATKEEHARLLTELDVDTLDARHIAAADRIAIGRALAQCGYLQFRRRRFSPTITSAR